MGNETGRLRLEKPELSLNETNSLSTKQSPFSLNSTKLSPFSAVSTDLPEEPTLNNSDHSNDPPTQFPFNANSNNYGDTLDIPSVPNEQNNNNNHLPLYNNYSNSSTATNNGYCSKFVNIPLSPTDSLSYSQKLGIVADQIQIPAAMMVHDDIIHRNQGKKASKKKKNRIFKFVKNKNNTNTINKYDDDYIHHEEDEEDEELSRSLSVSQIANNASKSSSVIRCRSRPNVKRVKSDDHIHIKSRKGSKNTHFADLSPKSVPCTTHSHKLKMYNRRKSVAISKVNNGITGKYISEKIANCAALFWIQNIDVLQRKDQLEIGCLQYFYLLDQYPEVKQFFAKDKIEETALRFFDMFGWLIRSLTLDGVNLWRVLSKVGEQHTRMSIRVDHYQLLLEAFHYAMSQTFTLKYTIEVKYCIDQIFTIATCIMTGHNYDQLSFGGRVLQLNDCRFLTNFKSCLDSDIGREYLYRYLGQTYCSEIVIFLQLFQAYNQIHDEDDAQKLIKAREIATTSLSPSSEFPINVSYAAMEEFYSRLKQCEDEYATNPDEFSIDPLLFDEVSHEVTKLILSNHWTEFVSTVKKMQRQQNDGLSQ